MPTKEIGDGLCHINPASLEMGREVNDRWAGEREEVGTYMLAKVDDSN